MSNLELTNDQVSKLKTIYRTYDALHGFASYYEIRCRESGYDGDTDLPAVIAAFNRDFKMLLDDLGVGTV